MEKKIYTDEETLNYNLDVYPDEISDIDVEEVQDFFARHGYNVTEDAIRHNFEAWKEDFKSGYRDEKNGYHLFTPCGCNPLAFRLSTLDEDYEDWQETYRA